MGFDGSGKIWVNGELVAWNDATIHVGAHVVHYGTSVFEGIRMYHRESTDGKSVVFRLREHIERLYNSAKIYRMTPDEMLLGGGREPKDRRLQLHGRRDDGRLHRDAAGQRRPRRVHPPGRSCAATTAWASIRGRARSTSSS